MSDSGRSYIEKPKWPHGPPADIPGELTRLHKQVAQAGGAVALMLAQSKFTKQQLIDLEWSLRNAALQVRKLSERIGRKV